MCISPRSRSPIPADPEDPPALERPQPTKKLALNKLIRIETAPRESLPAGSFFTVVVASHVDVFFNITLDVSRVHGRGKLVPAPGDTLTKRLHGLFPHPYAVFNCSIDTMGEYQLSMSCPSPFFALTV